tara:strand:- start:260 stop:706 length:447 start_codon:yes stop_codon:yes gene_type:complete
MEIAILGLGCFWGPERKFGEIKGVTKTEVGYCGGKNKETSYQEVCTGTTGHAEVVKIEFSESIISYEEIINLFFDFHDSTTLDRQGPDIGNQYRSEIFYVNESQKKIAEKVLEKRNENFKGRIVTKISEVLNYCKAEEYHQKYLMKSL